MRALIVRWSTWLSALLASSIPTVDMIDVYITAWWADWLDGLWTLVACALLVWLTDIVRRYTGQI